jgi:aspartyl-tRNA(Asn)/glutamyl-tRNA(Gln) amidotransferase subunit B
MRSKEEANDYRYFPDPDLLPVELDDSFIQDIAATLPELPDAKRHRFESDYGLSPADADTLSSSRAMADYYETVAEGAGDAKLAANWVMVELGAVLNKAGLDISQSQVDARAFAGLVARIQDKTISGKIAKQVFEAMRAGEGSADDIIEAKGLKQITDSGAIAAAVDAVIADNPKQVESYRAADPAKQPKMLGFFVGQVMKRTQGKANPKQVNELLLARLN